MIPKSIAVIGAGPSGAAMAKALLRERCFRIKVFERRSQFGGLWNYRGETDIVPIPSEKPYFVKPILDNDNIIWPTPAYEHLDTNVPKDVMTYGSIQFTDSLPIFPHRSDVNEYMQKYAEEIRLVTQLETIVVLVTRSIDKWKVVSRLVCQETLGGQVEGEKVRDEVEYFDAIAIAVGNYDVPYLPSKPGMDEWNSRLPNSISHVKTFKSCAQFANVEGNIVVVGNSASAADICYQLAEGLQKNIYKSKRSDNPLPVSPSTRIIEKPDIHHFDSFSKTVVFVDGTKTENVDNIIFATGYLKSFPFLKEFDQSSTPLITDGQMVHGTYQHIILYNFPNLAVLGLPKFVLPARTSESQACWLAKVWSGKLQIPSREKMAEWEQQRLELKGPGREFHDLKFPEDVKYCNSLNAQVLQNIESTGIGLKPMVWDKHQTRVRASMKRIKEAYVKYRTSTGKLAVNYEELEAVYPGCLVNDKVLEDHGFHFD